MTGANLAKDAHSRMTRHERLQYGWRGNEPPHRANGCDDLFVRELAERLATQQFLNGNLTLAKKDKYEIRTRAFIKQKMDRVCEGRAIPRSDVKALELAFTQGLPIYEIRWQRPIPLLENGGRDEMIRQYCAEPGNMDAWVFGLVVHFKTIDGLTSDEIHDAQDEHILEAVRQYKHNEQIGWDQLSAATERQVES